MFYTLSRVKRFSLEPLDKCSLQTSVKPEGKYEKVRVKSALGFSTSRANFNMATTIVWLQELKRDEFKKKITNRGRNLILNFFSRSSKRLFIWKIKCFISQNNNNSNNKKQKQKNNSIIIMSSAKTWNLSMDKNIKTF